MKQVIDPTKTSAAKRDLIEVLNLLKAGGSLDEGERRVKKLIETLGRDFDAMHVLGEVNDRAEWRSAFEMLGMLLLTNHAYRASSHSLLLAQLLFDVEVGKKNYQQVMSDSDYRGFIRSASLFRDIAIGMASWFEGGLGNAEASFKKAVVLLDTEDTLIEYLEGVIDLIKAEQKLNNLFALDDLQLFVEAVLELDYGRLLNDVRDIKKVDHPIAYTLSSVTSAIGSRGSCIAWYVLFLRVIVRILGFLEEDGPSRNFQAELTRRLGSIKQNNGVIQVGKVFLVECSSTLSSYKSLKDIPRGKQRDLIQILRPIRRFERRHVEKLYDDRESDRVERQLVGASESLNPLFELAYKNVPAPTEIVKTEKVGFEIWESGKSSRDANHNQVESLKKNENIALLLDENERLHSTGEDRTEFFRKKEDTALLAKVLLRNRGHMLLSELQEQLRVGEKATKSPGRSAIERRVRHLSSLLHSECGVKEKSVFYVEHDRVYCSSSARLAVIRQVSIQEKL